jgi:quercetin dioxygenase-like cupin family protein
MEHYQWSGIPVEQMNPLVSRQVIHAAAITLARLVLKKGALVPLHSHINEQISTVDSGSLRFVIGGRELVVKAGETVVIPPNVLHLVEAHEDATATDIFTPVREDWVRGDDAYLRVSTVAVEPPRT